MELKCAKGPLGRFSAQPCRSIFPGEALICALRSRSIAVPRIEQSVNYLVLAKESLASSDVASKADDMETESVSVERARRSLTATPSDPPQPQNKCETCKKDRRRVRIQQKLE